MNVPGRCVDECIGQVEHGVVGTENHDAGCCGCLLREPPRDARVSAGKVLRVLCAYSSRLPFLRQNPVRDAPYSIMNASQRKTTTSGV